MTESMIYTALYPHAMATQPGHAMAIHEPVSILNGCPICDELGFSACGCEINVEIMLEDF